jgi:hypothetical protein
MASIYTALTLHASGEDINEENIKRLLKAIGARIDEAEIKALVTLIEALKANPQPAEEKAQLPTEQFIDEKPLETPPTKSTTAAEALYLYCVGDGAVEASFGNIGIEGNLVYTVSYKDVSAVVHKCPPEPYQSEDNEAVKGWVIAHQSVVDAAWEKFGTVLPSGFDTIIKSSEAASAEENLKKWLEENYLRLRDRLDRVKGKAEFGVQIFWDRKSVGQHLLGTGEEFKRLNEEMKEKSLGTAYFYKQKIERALRKELEAKADEYFKEFYGRIKQHADDIRVEKTKRSESDKQMLLNLSVLIRKDRINLLGEELAKVKETEGIEVRFTGPWPPYSFVTSA